MTEIFPMVQPGGAGLDATAQAAGEPDRRDLPLYRDVLWDVDGRQAGAAAAELVGEPFEASGVIVTCTAMEDSPLEVVSHIDGPTDRLRLERCGINLLPASPPTYPNGSGMSARLMDDGSVEIDGTALKKASFVIFNGSLSVPAGTYSLSGAADGSKYGSIWLEIQYIKTDGSTAWRATAENWTTVPDLRTVQLAYIVAKPGAHADHMIFRPQIEAAEAPGPYTPYTGTSYTVDLGQQVQSGSYNWQSGVLSVTAPEPATVQLAPQTIPALPGINTIYADSGRVTVSGTGRRNPAQSTPGAVWSSSGPVIVEGARALEGWIWRALSTVRRRWPVFTHDYGCEAESLIGRPYTPEVRESEGIRMIREALEPSPYILGVRQAKISFEGSQLTLEAQIDTVYGEVHTNVRG